MLTQRNLSTDEYRSFKAYLLKQRLSLQFKS